MYFEFGVNIFTVFLFALTFSVHYGTCLKCFSCNSKTDNLCNDPFSASLNNSANKITDCLAELSTREFIGRFSNVMNLLGVPVTVNDKYTPKIKDTSKVPACQKVEIDDFGNRVTIRECAFFSGIVCDTLKNDNSDLSILYCDVCNTDYCNNSINVFFEWHLLLIIVLKNIIASLN